MRAVVLQRADLNRCPCPRLAPTTGETHRQRMTNTHARYSYDSSDEPTSVAVVRAVAEATDDDVFAMHPLQYVVETDALDTILERGPSDTRVSFTYAGCFVEAGADAIVVRTPSS